MIPGQHVVKFFLPLYLCLKLIELWAMFEKLVVSIQATYRKPKQGFEELLVASCVAVNFLFFEIVLGSEVSDNLICWNLEFSSRHDIISVNFVCETFYFVRRYAFIVTIDLVPS